MSEFIELASLVGDRVIDARADFVADAKNIHDEDAHVAVLRLDGVLYWFQENPSDGYRSMLGHIRIVEASELPPGALIEFERIAVDIKESAEEAQDTIIGMTKSGSVLFEIGTRNFDDYYPSFVSHWHPEVMVPW